MFVSGLNHIPVTESELEQKYPCSQINLVHTVEEHTLKNMDQLTHCIIRYSVHLFSDGSEVTIYTSERVQR